MCCSPEVGCLAGVFGLQPFLQDAWVLTLGILGVPEQYPAVLVYRTKDKGTRRVQGYVCAVRENGEPMRTKPTPTTNTHTSWMPEVADRGYG